MCRNAGVRAPAGGSPTFRNGQRRAEEFTSRAITSGEAERTARKLITIPTVVHVVYKKPAENISLAQIRSQMAALNKDFRATNPDTSKVPAPWKGLVADPKVKFQLATQGPLRQQDRRDRARGDAPRGFGAGDDVKRASRGGSTAWPTDAYLNLWVCTLEWRAARVRTVPRWPQGDRRRGDRQHRLRDRGHRGGAVQPGPHR